MPRQVTAFSNATVKRLRSLREKKARRAEGLFLAEGLRIVTEARDSGRLPELIAFSTEGAKHPLAAEIIAARPCAIEASCFDSSMSAGALLRSSYNDFSSVRPA